MTPPRQTKKFQKNYCRTLLNIARGDYATAKALQSAEGIRIENLFYMCQQSIEKTLKAVLVFEEKPVPMVHDLSLLISQVSEEAGFPFGYEINELSDFASVRRYEEGHIILDGEEVADVLNITLRILDWGDGYIGRT